MHDQNSRQKIRCYGDVFRVVARRSLQPNYTSQTQLNEFNPRINKLSNIFCAIIWNVFNLMI